MHLQLFMATLLGLVKTSLCQDLTPSAVRYIGVGYNLVEGNPEGGMLHNGGVDPGILPTRRIIHLSYEEGRVTADRRFKVPDEVNFSPRQSCVTETSTAVFSGGRSYQKQLNASVTASANFLREFSFTASSGFQEIRQESYSMAKVYCQKIGVCNRGRARFRDELAEKFSITDGFAADACNLPTEYDIDAYMAFFEDWGTHVIFEVDVGTKTVERNESTLGEFVRYAMDNVESSISIGGSFAEYSGSVSVDLDTFNRNMQQETHFGSETYRFTLGGQDLNEPIHIQVIPMVDVFELKYWTSLTNFVQKNLCNASFELDQVKLNIERALTGYAQWKNLEKPTDPYLQIPITWPRGTYGFPQADSGCPRDIWNTGYRYHDTEDIFARNEWSDHLHLRAEYNANNVFHYFCIKTVAEEDSYNWSFPPGHYCVYKKGPCPEGFQDGSIHWDDDNTYNQNKKEGVLPDGIYNQDTTIFFCCRTDGYTVVPIHLPTEKPFILFANDIHCQEVHGMDVIEEYFRWDTEDVDNHDAFTGSYPKVGPTRIRLTFCYYYKS